MNLLTVANVGKKYRIYRGTRLLTKELLASLLGRLRREDFWALRDVTFEVASGESIGIIGENGSGKSTLLRILSGVTEPTVGTVTAKGRVAALLELGAGFHPELSGLENIYLNGTLLGLSKRCLDSKIDEIIEFAGISEFINTPVKYYSSGMYVRLGFSVALHIDPDLLVIDEVLSVGDEAFQRRCRETINRLRASGKSLVVVSHDLSVIRDACDRALWLKEGVIHASGSIERITSDYLLFASAKGNIVMLSRGPITVVFERGKLILFYRGVELTKNLCGHTCLVTSGTWQSSVEALWHVTARDEHSFTAVADWRLVPVRQTWTVRLCDGGNIDWDVEMVVKESCRLQRDSLNLLLSEHYRRWVSESRSGEFPEQFFSTHGQPTVAVAEGAGEIGVDAVRVGDIDFPRVRLQVRPPRDDLLDQISNTDLYQKARHLQFSRVRSDAVYQAGERLTLNGRISIDEP